MAATDAPRSKQAAFDRAVPFKRFEGIGRTCRLIAAIETHPWAEDKAVKMDRQGHKAGRAAHLALPCKMRKAFSRSQSNVSKGRAAVADLRPIRT